MTVEKLKEQLEAARDAQYESKLIANARRLEALESVVLAMLEMLLEERQNENRH